VTDRPSRARPAAIVGFLLFAIAATAVAAYLHLGLPNIPDRDALYHLRHAAIYADEGILANEFPWTAYSVVSTFASDIWYGFHLLLIPFTWAGDPIRGVKLAGVFDLLALLVLLFFAVRWYGGRLPFLWPFLLLAFAPFQLYRLLMTRPHVISMGLAAVLVSCAVAGSVLGVGLLSLAITFIHLGFFWIIPLVIGAVAFTKWQTEGTWDWRTAAAGALGGALGWLLRPNPVGAAKLVYVQIIQLAVAKEKGLPLLFGGDLLPGVEALQRYPGELVLNVLPAGVLWLGTAVVFLAALCHQANLPPRRRTLLWSSLLLSTLSLVIAVQFSVRAVDLWSVFGVLFISGVFSFIARPRAAAETHYSTPRQLSILVGVGLLVMAFMAWRAADEYADRMRPMGYPPYRLRPAAQWLHDHAPPGDIVFNAHWDLFPELFFWNPRNRYVGGMDPIFQYAYDPERYWKAHHIYLGRAASHTAGTPALTKAQAEETYTVLRRDFAASYLLLEKKRLRRLYAYAEADPRFVLTYEDETVAIFRLEPRNEAASPAPD
jgi:hypothetical protein